MRVPIPMDSNIVKTAGEYETVIACRSGYDGGYDPEKKAVLEKAGITVKELLDRMIGLALKRARTESNLTFTFDTNILNSASFGGAKGKKV